MDPEVTTPPAAETPETPPVDQTSIADHEKAFGRRPKGAPPREAPKESSAAAVVEGETPEAKGAKKGERHRAKSQEASPEDVPRIKELTKKLRELRDQVKEGKKAPPASPSEPMTTPAAALEKPNPENFQTWPEYLDARDDYNRQVWDAEQRVRADNMRIANTWAGRVDEAKKLHTDFEDVALKTPTKIPPGSLMDAFILESEAGALILYAMQQDEDLRQRIHAMPPVQQAEALALLGHELSADLKPIAERKSVTPPAPRPPNPVKTGQLRSADELPSDEASIAEHEKAWGPKARRMR